jgi:hypothetical protein
MALRFVGRCLQPGGGTSSGLLSAFTNPDVVADQKDKKPLGVHSGWLIANFDTYPEAAEDGVVQRYTRSFSLAYG